MEKYQHRPIGQLLIFGIISLAAYCLVLFNEQAVIRYFSSGGVLPAAVTLLTAVAFSLIHGSFANYLLEMLGIRPVKKGVH
ncbi:MAG: hypothetical protein ACPLRU_07790 [Desulfofundulus sp.]|uniref:hypothetical protein n=1 Tax=Desulfofundulus sp. TaxID=2282750 RepID=UPI003C736CC5